MLYQDSDFQSHKQRLFFEYLKRKYPQFGLFYASPGICPKGYLEVFSKGLFRTRLIATFVINYKDEGYYFFTPQASQRNRKAILNAIQNCPTDCQLDLRAK